MITFQKLYDMSALAVNTISLEKGIKHTTELIDAYGTLANYYMSKQDLDIKEYHYYKMVTLLKAHQAFFTELSEQVLKLYEEELINGNTSSADKILKLDLKISRIIETLEYHKNYYKQEKKGED